MGVKMTGVNELKMALRKNMELSDAKRVVRKNGAELQERAQRNAPVDTGTLKRSIVLEIKDGGLTAESTATAEYAPYVEYGTRYMEAQPYMSPAFNEQKNLFQRNMNKLVK